MSKKVIIQGRMYFDVLLFGNKNTYFNCFRKIKAKGKSNKKCSSYNIVTCTSLQTIFIKMKDFDLEDLLKTLIK
jgi:hypothetical protein